MAEEEEKTRATVRGGARGRRAQHRWGCATGPPVCASPLSLHPRPTMTAPADTNAHTTISKLRSHFGNLGKGGLGKNNAPHAEPSSASGAMDTLHTGIDYSPAARNFTPKQPLRQLYPAIDPFKTGTLKVDGRHEVYWEVCGNEKGAPGKLRARNGGHAAPSRLTTPMQSSFSMAVLAEDVLEMIG